MREPPEPFATYNVTHHGCAQIDNAVQYHDDLEPKTADDELAEDGELGGG